MSVWDYFTPAQQEKMMNRMGEFSQEELKQMRIESNEIISKLIEGFDKGIPPEDKEIITLAKRLKEAQLKFSDPDPEVDKAIERFHIENPTEKDHGMDLEIYRYIEKAKSFSVIE